jgi:hypothetical protein
MSCTLTTKVHVHVETVLDRRSWDSFSLEYFSFLVSLSFQQFSILSYSSINDTIYANKFRASLIKALKNLQLIRQFYAGVKSGCPQLCLRMYVGEVVLLAGEELHNACWLSVSYCILG